MISTPTPFPVGPVNAYFLEGEPLTLVDTGIRSDDAWAALEAGIHAVGYRIADIQRILLTHPHMDHYGQARRLREESGAGVWAHELAVSDLQRVGHADPQSQAEAARGRAFFIENGVPEAVTDTMQSGTQIFDYLRAPVEVEHVLRDGDSVPFVGGELLVVHTPGHTPGHVCYLETDGRTLLSGDHLLPEITPVPLLHFPADPEEPKPKSLVDYMASVDKLRPMDVRRAVGGHGPAILDPPALYDSYAVHQQVRTQKIHRCLRRDGPQTAYDVCRFLFPHLSAFEVFLGMSEAVGHLEILVDEGRARTEVRCGRRTYEAVA